MIGKEVFDGVCATCHGLAGQGDYGPPLIGNSTLADAKALEQLLRHRQEQDACGRQATGTTTTMKSATTYLKGRLGGGQG